MMRAGQPLVQFEGRGGGRLRQINREDAARLTLSRLADFRRREVRNWRFGKHFTYVYDVRCWDDSRDAVEVREDYRKANEIVKSLLETPCTSDKHRCDLPEVVSA